MGCNDCQSPSLQGTQYCQECMPDESSVIIPDTIVPDPFLMDRNHIYLLPNGESYILNYDRTQAIKLGGGSSANISSLEDKIKKAQYDDTELRNKVNELSNKEDKDTIYNDTELKNRVTDLENRKLNYKFDEKSICITPYTPTKSGNTYIFNLTESVDKTKDEVIISLRTVNLLIPSYDSNDSYIVSKNKDTIINLPLNNSTDKHINTSILLYNGDIIHLSFSYRIDGDKLYISELNSFIDVGKVLGDTKTIKYDFLLNAGKLPYTIKNKEYFIRTDHFNALDIYKKTLEIMEDK